MDRALADVAAHLDEAAPPVTVGEILDARRDSPKAVLVPLSRTVAARRRPLLLAAAAAAVVALVAGIVAIASSSGSPSVSDQPGHTAPPRPADLPATGVVLSPEDALALWVARDALVRECMADKGFDYPLATADELIAAMGEWQPHPVLGIQRAGAARRVGYHAVGVGGSGAPSQAGAMQLMEAGERAAFDIALVGSDLAVATTPGSVTDTGTDRVMAGGCWGDVNAAALDHDEELRAAVNEAADLWDGAPSGAGFDDAARADRRVQAALDTWSSCVLTRTGEEADTPDELARRFLEGSFDGSATAEEIAVAVADAECQRDADLWTTWYSVVAELTRTQLGADAGLYDDWTSARVEEVRSAHATLAARNIDLPSLD